MGQAAARQLPALGRAGAAGSARQQPQQREGAGLPGPSSRAFASTSEDSWEAGAGAQLSSLVEAGAHHQVSPLQHFGEG
jgi:hypothetical protein